MESGLKRGTHTTKFIQSIGKSVSQFNTLKLFDATFYALLHRCNHSSIHFNSDFFGKCWTMCCSVLLWGKEWRCTCFTNIVQENPNILNRTCKFTSLSVRQKSFVFEFPKIRPIRYTITIHQCDIFMVTEGKSE